MQASDWNSALSCPVSVGFSRSTVLTLRRERVYTGSLHFADYDEHGQFQLLTRTSPKSTAIWIPCWIIDSASWTSISHWTGLPTPAAKPTLPSVSMGSIWTKISWPFVRCFALMAKPNRNANKQWRRQSELFVLSLSGSHERFAILGDVHVSSCGSAWLR